MSGQMDPTREIRLRYRRYPTERDYHELLRLLILGTAALIAQALR